MKFNLKILIFIVIFTLVSSSLISDSSVSLDEFKKIIILEDGRKKPIDTFAQNILKQFSGKGKFDKAPAVIWLARLLFTPDKSYDDMVFLVNNPEVLSSIGSYTGKGRGRYSYRQLSDKISKLRELAISASRIENSKRSIVESEIIVLYNKIYVYHKLAGAFQFCFPSTDFENNSFLNYLSKIKDIKDIKAKKIESLSESEREILHISHKMDQWSGYYQDQQLDILPNLSSGEEKWESPWDSVNRSFKFDEPPATSVLLINKMVSSFRNNDQVGFDSNVKEFNNFVMHESKHIADPGRIKMEIMYNRIDPFYKSEFFYGFSLLFLLLSYIKFRKLFYYSSYFLLILGLLPHTYGMIARMIIRNRPPVTNLFETFVFAAWITALLGLALELFKKKNIGILTGSLSGLVLLIISGRYALEGDTMGMLVAVLDSNFWLATHVITITIGYGGVVISGVLGHLYILQAMFKKSKKKETLKDTYQSVYATQAFGLIFTFIGTVLGGIWADQSWGRFWGWDPKENGALLIILWSAIMFHGKMGKMIKELGFSLGSIVGIITVVLAWFGVNLLGVGLHNYGFSSNVASAMMIYIILELLFMGGSYIYLKQKKL